MWLVKSHILQNLHGGFVSRDSARSKLAQVAMASAAAPAPPDATIAPTGPNQRGRGVQGQYAYLIVFAHPTPENVQKLGLKTPSDFAKPQFRALVLECHAACDVELVETAGFQELHSNGLPHLNLLVRSKVQYRWLKPAQELRKRNVNVDFAKNVKSWAEGVAYLHVGTEHKPPESLDKDPDQWAKEGQPVPLKEFLPKRWHQEGLVRKTRLSSLSFFDLCRQHGISSVEALWAKATELSETGDRGLLAYLLDNDGEGQFGKVLKALGAEESQRRAKLTREALLEEYYQKHKCKCDTEGQTYALMKQLLQNNHLDGQLQADVMGALRAGRAKQRNVCLVGDANCGKTFLFKGLKEVFYTYERLDSGTYQLEALLEQELVFLNDFEYDTAAKDWMSWSYFKRFLEGGSIPVGRPKNKGGNQVFSGTAPVLATAPKPVTLLRYGKEIAKEREQMDARFLYRYLPEAIPAWERQEVTHSCGHCTARLYLEGKAFLDNSVRRAPQLTASQPVPKKQRTANDTLKELQELKELLDAGVLTSQEFDNLKTQLLQEAA